MTDDLTRLELCALVDFLSAALNDPDTLASSGQTPQEQAAIRRAHDKLIARTAHPVSSPTRRSHRK
jgi:hypothetical protein